MTRSVGLQKRDSPSSTPPHTSGTGKGHIVDYFVSASKINADIGQLIIMCLSGSRKTAACVENYKKVNYH
jgi:hypothetical protein